jgi:hypothetical protein
MTVKEQRTALFDEMMATWYLPYAVVMVWPDGAPAYRHELSKEQYDYEMRADRPWAGPNGEMAEYLDDESEALQKAYYEKRVEVHAKVNAWNETCAKSNKIRWS